MLRHVLIFGLVGGALVVLLKLTEYRLLVIEHSFELYAGLIAAIFAAFGIWLGIRLNTSRHKIITVQVPQPNDQPFTINGKKRDELGITPRELEILEQGLSRFPASPELAAAMKSVDGEVSGIEVQASQSIAL